MSWLQKDLKMLSATAEEEFYEALSSGPEPQHGCGEAEQGERLSRSEEGSQMHFLALHRAAFEGDVAELRRLLPMLSPRQRIQLDPQGNTALHVAVLRHQYEAISVLLDGGLPPDVKNQRQWNPVDEAVALGDAAAAKLLYGRLLAAAKRAKRAKKEQLVGIMQKLPDFKMQLRWELGSPLFGLLLRHYAPDDTYSVHKVGKLLRVDGTLMGMEERSHGLIPRWKRGSFSLLVDAGATPTAAFLVDHTTRCYYDLYRERKAHLRSVDEEVADMLADGAGKVRLADADLDFKPVKNWLGRPKTEKVEGWETEVFEASGSLVAASWQKAAVVLPAGASWEEYLDMEMPEDVVQEMPLDPLSPPDKPKTKAHAAAAATAGVPAPPPPATPAKMPGVKAVPSAQAGAAGARDKRGAGEAAGPQAGLTAGGAAAQLAAPAARPGPVMVAAAGGVLPAEPHTPKRVTSSSTFASAGDGDNSTRSGSSYQTATSAGPSVHGASGSSRAQQQQRQQPQQAAAAAAPPDGQQPAGLGKAEGKGKASSRSGGKVKGRTFSSRCWLARGYPVTLAQVIPLLEVVAAGNKHFAQAAAYLRQFRSDEYFPVKTQIPLMWTVYLLLTFRQFCLLGPADEARHPGFFELPAGYRLDHMEEGDLVQKKVASPLLERLDSGGVP